ncbi:flagellar biosynthesis protein FlhA [Chromatocurvus halotolerans]|uniref:Flagellar biosynthesis protein FlhA n=2 Tax=Chromatocurvus halotolerans TaxID=1132028 RepID=A0A4R2L200_9GAMM|nr:flagellar biosynthesis protein FlhA [Chromatocurvus halotolerans]TCO76588.1 flagellar biosynthesis protein FlhA [Chromatocurvus halotolerans]
MLDSVKLPAFFQRSSLIGIGGPLLVMLVLAMVVLPLPAAILDILFTFNITLSIAVILSVIYIRKPLEFGVFPTVLLLSTLLRLALNIASTRVVLLEGHTGGDAAGKVIQAFGEFVIGGNYAVGLVVFAILVIINFVVVTKGATRVSEVTARFTLDAMPGKQMAIDADVNAGLIDQEEAGARREEIRQEADFYGAMDGASKFVRGDAVAGIIILVINIVGGLLIGTLQRDMSFGAAVERYALLTVGDGLVAQIPALLLSTAVAMIVTRMSRSQDMGQELFQQVFGQPRVLTFTAAVLGLMGMIPGMPNVAFLLLAAVAGSAAWLLHKRREEVAAAVQQEQQREPPVQPEAPRELDWGDIAQVDPVGLEVGYRLVPLVDRAQGGELMGRIKGVRKKLSQSLGFLISAVHIRDNLELAPNQYRISIFGVPCAEAEVRPDRELAINPGGVSGTVQGQEAVDPAFGMPAVWIDPASREHAQTMGYTVADSATVIATHLSQTLKKHAHELLGHQEVQNLLDQLAKSAPKLVEDLTPKTLPLSVIVRVLQQLLAEQVPIRNFRGICEALAEHGARSQDIDTLLGAVRVALGRQIVQELNGMAEELPVVTLAPDLESLLVQLTQQGSAALEPGLAERIQESLQAATRDQEMRGEPAVLLVPGEIRPMLARFARQGVPGLHVLAHSEIPEDKQLRLVQSVARNTTQAA